MCRAPLPFAVGLRAQPGLTANLEGFRIRAPEGWPPFATAPASPGDTMRHSCGLSLSLTRARLSLFLWRGDDRSVTSGIEVNEGR